MQKKQRHRCPSLTTPQKNILWDWRIWKLKLKKTLDISDIIDRPRSSREQLDGVNSQNKDISQLKPDIRTAISIAEKQDKTISKMETAMKYLEKGAADKEIVNKSTVVSLEDKCNTLADRTKEANAYTKSDIE